MARKSVTAAVAALVLSVIIPTGGDMGRLAWCLAGLARQEKIDPAAVELIIIGDALTVEADNALASLLGKWEPFLPVGAVLYQVLPAGENTGRTEIGEAYRPCSVRNLGIQLARGEQCVFLDEDCIPDAGWLAAHYSLRGTATYGYRRRLPEREVERLGTPEPDSPVPDAHLLMLADGYDIRTTEPTTYPGSWLGCNCAAPTVCLREIGGFDGGGSCADMDLAVRLTRHGTPFRRLGHGDDGAFEPVGWVTHLDHPRRPRTLDTEAFVASIYTHERPIIAAHGALKPVAAEAHALEPIHEEIQEHDAKTSD